MSSRNGNDSTAMATIRATERCTPPQWALLEQLLFDTLNQAAEEFVERYTRSDGTLIWRNNWPGMDGSDIGSLMPITTGCIMEKDICTCISWGWPAPRL
ncbi:hypothetical protein O9H85_00435 [Paenibacillus filicis]|uniref:Uncharacterized protein n=1 Tax=Paenibacillus gyeongsangnamensis TaxID=3388067 RepID=A0ABT4Q217_9BACL|nr:hypothetical protein [Paenibacillus filicis]MCZ8510927.1 hypothetical protein [Paenibacillus filicis]